MWRVLLLAGLWVSLNGADIQSWIVGAPAVLGAAALSLALVPPSPGRLALSGVLPLVALFLRESLAGGLDVARRALGPSCRLDPGFIDFQLRLPSAAARMVFCLVTSLLPGTYVVAISDRSVTVHALDRTAGVEAGLRTLERRVAALFHVTLPRDAGDG